MMTPEELAREQEWADNIKYHAARYVWLKRRQRTSDGRMSWAQWFEKKFGEPLNDYAKRMAEKKRHGKT